MKVYCYYDGIPQWIEELSSEERKKFIEEETKRCALINEQRKKEKRK